MESSNTQPTRPEQVNDSASDRTTVDVEMAAQSQSTAAIHTGPRIEGEDFINLPIRTLSNDAQLQEYTEETLDGQMLRVVKTETGKVERYELVTWKINDPENPKNWSKAMKWYCTMVVAFTCFVVAFNSSVITADIAGLSKEFGISEEVALLSITVFVIGFGVGEQLFGICRSRWKRLLIIGKAQWRSRLYQRSSVAA